MSILSRKSWRALLAATLISAFVSGCSQPLPAQHFRILAFGTFMDLQIVGAEKQVAKQAQEALQNDFNVMHYAWHAWEPGPVVRMNGLFAEGVEFSAPPSVLPLLQASQTLASQSDYLFDPAIGKLIDLWGFHQSFPEAHEPPSDADIQALVDMKPSVKDISVNGFRLQSSNPAVQLDFGAIGRGYGIDQAIRRLQEMGIHNAVIRAGSDLRAIGSRDGTPWRIPVRDPDGGGVFALIPVIDNEAVFTSGNYQRNFTWDGKFFHHILDPRTGKPAVGTRSVTVIHPDATTADAAATALFIAGPKDWHRVAQQMGIKYVMLIDENNRVHMNPKMRDRVKLQRQPAEILVSKPL